jgi:hypothetical protein
MTRRDFELIARCVRAARPCGPKPAGIGRSEYDAAISAVDAITLNLTEALTLTNPRFDAGRFMDACELAS